MRRMNRLRKDNRHMLSNKAAKADSTVTLPEAKDTTTVDAVAASREEEGTAVTEGQAMGVTARRKRRPRW